MTDQHNHAGRCGFVLFTLGVEQNTLASLLSPRGIVVCQLRLCAVNVACKGFGLDSLVAEPEVVLLVALEHPAM